MNQKTLLGRSEEVILPELGKMASYARVDTGAKTSAIWVSSVREVGNTLKVVFYGKGSPLFTGETVVFQEYAETVVASSNGAAERRYKVKLLLEIGGKRIRAWFTLADRSTQVYPILVGRNVLRGKFVVDVSLGAEALLSAEKSRSMHLQKHRKESK